MSLYEKWVQASYFKDGSANENHWNVYMPKEQKIYEDILENKKHEITGTVKQLSEKYDMPVEWICGFVDGINDVLPKPYEIDKMDETTEIKMEIDFEKLYKKMVEYKAEHLYNLPQWKSIFTDDELKAFYTQQRQSTTFIRNDHKVGRNDMCPCGSGKKYKKCCGVGQ